MADMKSIEIIDVTPKRHIWRTMGFLALIIIATVFFRFYILDYSHLTDGEIDELKDDNGNYYLAKYDPYAYYGDAKNSIEGKNLLTDAEIRFSQLTGQDILYMAGYLPIMFICIAMIFLFFIIRMYTENDWLAFIGTLAYSLNIEVLLNTFYLYTDTDALNIMFSVIIVYLVLKIYWHVRNTISATLEGAFIYFCKLSLLIMAVLSFSYAWTGWFYILMILFAAIAVHMLFNVEKGKAWLIGGSVALFLFISIWKFKKLQRTLFFTDEKLMYINELSMNFSLHTLLFYVLLSLVMLKIYYKDRDDFSYTFLLVWFMTLFIAGFQASRHLIYFLLPVFILLSMGLSNLIEWINIKRKKDLNMPVLISFICMFILLLGFMVRVPAEKMIVMDDTVANAMMLIPDDSRVISWWDYGHIYGTYTNAKILFTNAPNIDRFKLLAKLYATTDEAEAYDIVLNFTKGKRSVLVFSSADLDKSGIISHLSRVSMTKKSMLHLGVIGYDSFEHFRLLGCSHGSFKDICVYEVVG